MSLDPSSSKDTNRFTIADYQYDHEDDQPVASGSGSGSKSGPSDTGYPNSILSPPAVITLMPLPPAIIETRPPKKQISGGSSNSSERGKLRLHQAEPRPVYSPSTIPSSSLSVRPLSPNSSINDYFGSLSPSASKIRPLPSIPRLFSSSSATNRQMETISPSTLSPPIQRSSPGSPRSPATPSGVMTPDIERLSPFDEGALATPINLNRSSHISSAACSTHDIGLDEKDRDLRPPVLNRGISGSKATSWWDRVGP